MGELIAKLGLDWRLLLAQAVNFGILVAVLTWAVYRPLLKVMAERRARIERGLADAEAARHKLEEFERWKQEQLREFRRQADAILTAANQQAEATIRAAVSQAAATAAKTIQQAKLTIAAEKEQMLRDLQGQLADLVVEASAKVLPGSISQQQRRQLVDDAIAAVKP
mgnify:CR=1 FL=1